MTTRIRNLFLASASVASIATAIPAFAQDTASGVNTGEIIVTARRTEERLQDVPISMTVFNQQQIADRNILVASDLATYTPSLSVNQRYGVEKASFAIRGFNQENSTQATVGVYFADVVGLRAQGGTTGGSSVGAGAFMDLQNVQVLKGPQGTLFGRNTTGGAILLVPTKPTDRLEGYVEGSAGDYDMRRAQAVINIPLADTFRVRASVDRNKRDGYMRNRSGIGPKDYNDVNYFAARLSVVAELTPDLENYTIVHYSNSFGNGYANRYVACDRTRAAQPFAANFSNLASALGARVGCAQVDRHAARGDDLLDVEVNAADPRISIKQWQVINTTTWQASDSLTIKNIASYGEYIENSRFNLFSDNAFVPEEWPVPASRGNRFQLQYLDFGRDAGATASQSTITEELQLQFSSSDGSFNGVLGGYLEFSRPISWNTQTTAGFMNCAFPQTLECDNPLAPVGNFSLSKTQLSFNNHGVFGQGTYQFTDELALTIGGRWTFDKIRAVSESTRLQFNPQTGQFFQVCNDITRFYVTNPISGARSNLPVTHSSQCHNVINNSSDKPTWLVNLDYKPVEDLLLYGKYARGYRQGGINLTNIGLESWGPEQLDSFEVGAKWSFRGALRGYLNVAAFYNDLKGAQIFGALGTKDSRVIVGGTGIANAGKARMQGIEVDGSVNLLDGLKLDLGYTYLDTELVEFTPPTIPADSPFLSFTPNADEGDALPFAPKHRVTLTGTYMLPLPETVGELSIGASYIYTAEQIANKGTPVYGRLPATNLVNLNINWNRVLDGPVDASFFVTNLTDKIYRVNTGGAWTSFGFADVMIAAPRMLGFRLRYNFGG